MVEKTICSTLKAKHKLGHLVESSTDGSQDATERKFQEIKRVTEQTTLSAIKTKEKMEEISV